ncbi:MAG: HAMP domain-containing protein [Cloacibacillus sp.]|nr:HAMP domain-containing protein [Cloacibacillus sp.]
MKSFCRLIRPDSLFGLILLILVLGAAANQFINFYAVCSIQHSYAGEVLGIGQDYVSSVYQALNTMDGRQRGEYLKKLAASRDTLRKPFRFRMAAAPDWQSEDYYKSVNMKKAVSAAVEAAGANTPDVRARMLWPESPEAALPEYAGYIFPMLQVMIRMDDGGWLELTQPLSITDNCLIWRQRIFVLLESLIFSLIVIILIRCATRPIERLAQEAERFGRNPEAASPLDDCGSREIREAAQSFNRMRARICDNLNERNGMLEAMGHDLRTPLARIQLRLGKIEPRELREKFAANIEEIRSIIEQGLELARSLHTSERAVPMDIVAFVESVADDMERGEGEIRLGSLPEEDTPLLVSARPTCLKRCIENLLTNAVKYAGGAVISVTSDRENVSIRIEDEGPGIPEELLEKVFEPYYRLEGSRNRESGGTGLGLSIARNMVLLNDGSLVLKNRPSGGLCAVITLPVMKTKRRA